MVRLRRERTLSLLRLRGSGREGSGGLGDRSRVVLLHRLLNGSWLKLPWRRILHRRIPHLLGLSSLLHRLLTRSMIRSGPARLPSRWSTSATGWHGELVSLVTLIPMNDRLRTRIGLTLRHSFHLSIHSSLSFLDHIIPRVDASALHGFAFLVALPGHLLVVRAESVQLRLLR